MTSSLVPEVLRKYPPTPVLIRQCQRDYKIPGSEATLDQGTSCWIFILGIHYDPQYYPEPEKFDPQRFSEEENAKRQPYTYLPFGDGPRNCIAQRFAWMQLKVGIVQLIRNYSFSVDSKMEIPIRFRRNTILLLPKDKILLNVMKIND